MKKNKLLFVTIICIILISLIVSTFMLKKDNQKEKDNFVLDKEIINRLLDNSYKYYLIKESLVKVGTNEFESNNRNYYNVEEEWLTSFDDIRQLVEDTFSKVRVNTIWNQLIDEQVLIKTDNVLYIYVPEEKCEINYTIDKEKIKYTMLKENQARLDLEKVEIYMYKEENGWRFDSNPYDCNFNN